MVCEEVVFHCAALGIKLLNKLYNMPKQIDFQAELDVIFCNATGRYVDVVAGNLHRKVGGYPPAPGCNHAMPNCCRVMKKNMKDGDVILKQPPKGQGARVTIRYQLPR